MKYILTLFILTCTFILNAQDIIYKKDKTKIDAKVLEIGTSEVKYKPTSNPDGPLYLISKSDIATIVFQNGTFEVFSTETQTKKRTDTLSGDFCRNFIGTDIAQFATLSAGVVYEHVFGKKGMCAIRIPFNVGLRQNNYDYGYPQGKLFGTGFDFMYFPTGQGTFKYFAAPYFEWGMFRYRYYSYYSSQYPYPTYTYSDGQHLAGGIKNGIMYQPTKHFCISADFGLGIQKDERPAFSDEMQGHFQGNVIIGYRF